MQYNMQEGRSREAEGKGRGAEKMEDVDMSRGGKEEGKEGQENEGDALFSRCKPGRNVLV